MIVIIYTTQYRKGGIKFKRVAETMALELNTDHEHIECIEVNAKLDFKKCMLEINARDQTIDALHFIGHSGMYGPMFGTVSYPEQFSPHEWQTMDIPFSKNATAYFHCCRSARWFAPFFARTFRVETHGFHLYTTFSSSKERFRLQLSSTGKLYCVGCIGKKSHGIFGSVQKYLGAKTENMKTFQPQQNPDTSYNSVAHLYDKVFQDIRVREDEWKWLKSHLSDTKNSTVIDIGCGNGALLKQLAPMIETGIGFDLSSSIIEKAKTLNAEIPNVSFHKINGPSIPVKDQSIDIAISMLSFRYLDWDPLLNELNRVLKPNGRLLIIDMVAVPPKLTEFPALIRSIFRHYRHRKKYPEYYSALKKLVSHPDWQTMLQYNPIRSEHEMKWYLESRFPGQHVEKINVGRHASILAFDSGPMKRSNRLELTYP